MKSMSGKQFHAAKRVQAAKKYVVCPKCQGHGTVTNPSMSGVLDDESVDELREFIGNAVDRMEDSYGGVPTPEMRKKWQEEASEEYWRRFDQSCPTCKGQRVIDEADLQRFAENEEWENEIRNEERMLGNHDF